MAIPSIPIIPKDISSITFSDATGTPISGTVSYSECNISISSIRQGGREVETYANKDDQIYAARLGPQQSVEISFSVDATELLNASDKLLVDAIRKTGAFAAGVSTWGSDVADPWMLAVVLAVEGTDRGGVDQTITFPYFRGEVNLEVGRPSKWQVTGTAYPKGATAAMTIA